MPPRAKTKTRQFGLWLSTTEWQWMQQLMIRKQMSMSDICIMLINKYDGVVVNTSASPVHQIGRELHNFCLTADALRLLTNNTEQYGYDSKAEYLRALLHTYVYTYHLDIFDVKIGKTDIIKTT